MGVTREFMRAKAVPSVVSAAMALSLLAGAPAIAMGEESADTAQENAGIKTSVIDQASTGTQADAADQSAADAQIGTADQAAADAIETARNAETSTEAGTATSTESSIEASAESKVSINTPINVQADKEAPSSYISAGNNLGSDFKISFADPEWLSAVSDVVVNGITYTRASSAWGVWNDTHYYVDAANKTIYIGEGYGSNEPVICAVKAAGFSDLIMMLSKANFSYTVEVIPPVQPEEPAPLPGEDSELKDAPAAVDRSESNFGYDFKLAFSDTEWMSAITSVTVNGITYERATSSFGVWGNAQYYVGDDYAGGLYLLIGEGALANVPGECVITAEGYKDLVLTLDPNGKLASVAPANPIDPVQPDQPVDPIDPADPIEPDPVDPIDPELPTDPVESDDPDQSTDPSDSSSSVQPEAPALPVWPSQSGNNDESSDSSTSDSTATNQAASESNAGDKSASSLRGAALGAASATGSATRASLSDEEVGAQEASALTTEALDETMIPEDATPLTQSVSSHDVQENAGSLGALFAAAAAAAAVLGIVLVLRRRKQDER